MFGEFRKGKLALKNRFVRSATWEELADEQGHINDKLLKIYENLAQNEVGLIITGAISVSEKDWALRQMFSLASDEYIKENKNLTDLVHQYGVKVWAQLALMGANIYESFLKKEVNSFLESELKELIVDFGKAAKRAEKAGYDGIQIHSAHGFLPSRFLSPKENKRDDQYGGSLENRTRFLKELFEEANKNTGDDFLISVKINGDDFTEGGFCFEESLKVCKEMTNWGIDSIQVSGNTPSRVKIDKIEKEAYFKDFAVKIADEVDIPIILSGGIKHLETVEELFNNSKISCFAFGRPLLCEYWLISRWLEGDRNPSRCVFCNNCFNTRGHSCVCNFHKD